MKDIQEIINEMNSVVNELAPTVDLGLTCTCNAPCRGTGGISVCGTSNNVVRGTCAISIPTGFALDGGPVIVGYNLNSLRAIVEPCSCNGTTKFDVRIVGSIPFVVNILLNPTGICTSPANSQVFLGCSGVANVDNIIGFSCDETSALIANGIINGSLLNCNGITATAAVTICQPGSAIVTVTFTLPACSNAGAALTEE